MKNVIIYHGTGGTPDSFWFPYIKQHLETNGYTVDIPQLPGTDHPTLESWLPFALKHGIFTNETILIGHSAGCPLILSILENIDVQINQVILVAGFSQPLSAEPDPILQDAYDWQTIKSHVQDLIFINSDDDPWGCNDQAGRVMFDHLGGTFINPHGQGHMGSDAYNQPYQQFPLLLKLIN